jgi:hypothetical protein
MVLTSRREVAGRHCLTFRLVADQDHGGTRRPADKPKGKGASVHICDPSIHPTLVAGDKSKKAMSKTYWTMRNNHHQSPIASHFSDKSIERECDESFEKNHWMAKFFRTTYADFLLNPVARIFVITGFIAYLGISLWGCSEVKLGLEPNDLLPDDSYAKRTLIMQEKYFTGKTELMTGWFTTSFVLQNTDHSCTSGCTICPQLTALVIAAFG